MRLKIKKYDEYDFRTRRALEYSIWEDEHLKSDVQEALLKIAENFIDFLKLGLTIKDIKDIQLTGSLANYNYTKYSDLDLHILFDFDEIIDDERLVKEFLMSKKALWNNSYSIKIKGWEVEIYPQNIKEKHISTGVYSVLNDEWIKKPEEPTKVWATTNLADIKKKVKEIKYEIDNIDQLEDSENTISRVKEKIKNMRQSGLESGGEYSVENLAFKALRRMGEVGKLYALGREEYQKSLSLNGIHEKLTKEQLYDDVIGILKEDAEWWKKRRATDKKNLRVLIGHVPGAKGKYVKSGAPFTNDPPKYSGNKLGPGLGLLEEQTEDQALINFLKSSKPGDSLVFSVLKTIKGGPFNFVVFKPGKQYSAVVTDDGQVFFKDTELLTGSQTQTKEEVIKTLTSGAGICKAIDCNSAKATVGGQSMNMAQLVASKTSTAVPAPGKGAKISKDAPISDEQQKNITKKLTKKYIPDAAAGTLDKIGDWFANNPYIKTVGELLEKLWGFFKGMFSGLGISSALGFGDKEEEKALPSGAGQTAVLIGDSQMGSGLGRALKEKVEAAGYKICNGCKQNYDGASVDVLAKKINIKSVLEEQRPSMVVIAAGGNGSSGAGNFIDKIKEWHPEGDKVKIYWFGPPPSVVSKTGSRKFVDAEFSGFKFRKEMNEYIASSAGNKPNVTFINPYEHVTDFYKKGGDGLHMPYKPAKKFVDIAFGVPAAAPAAATGDETILSDKESVVNQIKKGLSATQKNMASIIEREFKAAGLPPSIAAAAIVNAHSESGINPYAVGDGGNSVGLFQIHRGSDKNPFWLRAGLKPEVTKETLRQYKKGAHRKNKAAFAAARLAAGDFRFDPARNAQTMINYEVKKGAGSRLRARAAAGASVAELAGIFSSDIERPKDKQGNIASRSAKARKWFA